MLCSLCAGFDIHALVAATAAIDTSANPKLAFWPITPPSYRWHVGQATVFQNAKNGCELCFIVWQEWTKNIGKEAHVQQAFIDTVNRDPARGGKFWITPKCVEKGVLVISNESPDQKSIRSYADSGSGAQAAFAQRLRDQAMVSYAVESIELRLLADRGKRSLCFLIYSAFLRDV